MDKNIININTNASDIPQEFAEVSTLCVATEVMIGGRSVLGIADARTLHEGLGVGKFFANWIKDRITTYSFKNGEDYQSFDLPNLANQKSGRGGDRKTKVYRLTLDMAKELAMVENNEKGRLIRRYFIWCENQLRSQSKNIQPNQLGGIVKGIVNKSLLPIKEQFETQIKALCEEIRFLKSSYDPSGAFVTDYKPIIEFLKDMNVPQKGRKRLVYKCSNRCRNYLAIIGKGEWSRKSRETGRWIYHIDGVNEWLKYEGHAVIALHMDKVNGQGRLQLVPQA